MDVGDGKPVSVDVRAATEAAADGDTTLRLLALAARGSLGAATRVTVTQLVSSHRKAELRPRGSALPLTLGVLLTLASLPFIYSSLRTAAASLPTRSGSAIASISTILPSATVKPITAKGRPPTVTTTPAAPFISAGRNSAAGMARACLATAAAPRITLE